MHWVRWGSLVLAAGIALGAFGTHALQGRLAPDMRAVYQTAVLYHLIHGVGLLAVGWMAVLKPSNPLVQTAGWALLLGIGLFSGSLYLVSLTGLKKLGMITPIGGLAFLWGWICLALAAR